MWTNDGPNLYLAADQSTVVQEDDPRARFLLVASGGQLPIAEAERYGLTADRKAAAAEKAKAEPTPNKLKQPPPPNKSKG